MSPLGNVFPDPAGSNEAPSLPPACPTPLPSIIFPLAPSYFYLLIALLSLQYKLHKAGRLGFLNFFIFWSIWFADEFLVLEQSLTCDACS